MGLYQDWLAKADEVRDSAQQQAYWDAYFAAETEVYRRLLADHGAPYAGTLGTLVDAFQMAPMTFAGFVDGINTSLVSPVDVESLDVDTPLTLDIDFEKLYYNMHAAKAPWLYGLDEWDGVLTEAQRKEIARAYRQSGIFVKGQAVGRNDPCPCGSGKKYKKCCGKAET